MTRILTILLMFFFLKSNSQDVFIEKIVKPLVANKLYLEKTFIHTNKSIYYNEETIWFQVYVGNTKNEPSVITNLLYVDLMNQKGEKIDSKNIYIKNGIGIGQIDLQSNIPSGKYYITGQTNFMKNFGENAYFIKEIDVNGTINKPETSKKKHYDIQLLPENGYIVEDLENMIAIKSLLNGYGNDFEGKIINSKNEEIVSFKNKHLGMSSCKFFVKKDEKYFASITTNDTILKIEIPKPIKNELKLEVLENSLEKILLKINSTTEVDVVNNNYTLLFHQKNNLFSYLKIAENKQLNTNIEIDKKIFLNGVNSITLFKNYNPIGTRKIYIENENEEVNLIFEKIKTEIDSITYKIKFKNNNIPLNANFSISALLENNTQFNETTSIKSAFYLSPYINGFIENASSYFNVKNKNRLENIELLLLTQGFEKYNFEEMITNLNPKEKHQFENGFKLKGTVNPLLTTHLGLMSKNNKLIQKIYLNNTSFEFFNLLLYKNDEVKISFLNTENEAIKPINIKFEENFNNLDFNQKVNFNTKKSNLENTSSIENFSSKNITILKEITILEKKILNKREREIFKKYKPLIFDLGAYYELDLPEKKDNELFLNYFLRTQNANIVNWKGIENYLQISNSKEAILYVNGKKLESSFIPTLGLKMKDVEAFFKQPFKSYNKYQIFTTDNYNNDIVELFDKFVINNGYDQSKTYYNPTLNFQEQNKIIEIDWKNNLKTDEHGELLFKIPNNSINSKFIFSIQGFSNTGILISELIYN